MSAPDSRIPPERSFPSLLGWRRVDGRPGVGVNSVARGSVLGMVGQGWHLLTAFALYAYLARELGPALFGRWGVVLSVLAWFELFVTAGAAKVATKRISEEKTQAGGIAGGTYVAQAVVGAALFLAVVLLAPLLADLLGHPAFTTLLRVSALDIPLYGAFMAASAVVLGTGRYGRQGIGWIVYSSAKAGLVATLVALGYSVTGALIGNALASVVGLAAMALPRGKSVAVDFSGSRSTAYALTLASGPFLALALLEGFVQHVDLWLVSGIITRRVDVGLYAAATVLAEIPVFLFLGLNRVIFPSVAGARAAGCLELADRYTAQAVRAALIITAMGVGLAAGAGRQVLEFVYSRPYAAGFIPLVFLMSAGLGRTVQATCTEVLMAQDRRRLAVGILFGTVVAEVAFVVLGSVTRGITGAAIGAAAATVSSGFIALMSLRGAFGMSMAGTAVRAITSSGVLAWVLALFNPPAGLMPLVILGVSGAYVGLLLAAGEFTARDREMVRAIVGR